MPALEGGYKVGILNQVVVCFQKSFVQAFYLTLEFLGVAWSVPPVQPEFGAHCDYVARHANDADYAGRIHAGSVCLRNGQHSRRATVMKVHVKSQRVRG